MLSLLKDYKGLVEINGKRYESIDAAIKDFTATEDIIRIKLTPKRDSALRNDSNSDAGNEIPDDVPRRITVRQYMTKKSTPEFAFMKDYNSDIPMPMITMIGVVTDRIYRRVYMKLHGDITQEKTMRCLKCGRAINNPVSQYFGLGPECGGHGYINPFYTEDDLKLAVEECRKKLQQITWEGWIPKSAIVLEERI